MGIEEQSKWIMEPMHGVAEDSVWDSPFVLPVPTKPDALTTQPPLKAGLVNPPSYLVQTLLIVAAGFRWQRGEKSAWEIRLTFEGKRFRLWDYRRSSWSIGYIGDDLPTAGQISRLIKKISQAADRLDTVLGPELSAKVENGEFYLMNSHRHINGAFDYFKGRITETLGDSETWRSAPAPSFDATEGDWVEIPSGGRFQRDTKLEDHFNQRFRLDEAISHNSVAAVGFFFSYVELMLDAWFAFHPKRHESYSQFQDRTWDERFKMVLPVSKDKDLRELYERGLRPWRKRIRDQMFHGLGGTPGLLVPLGPLGLVPLSPDVIGDQPHFAWQPVSEQEAKELLMMFEAFDQWIEGDDFAWYVKRFVAGGFEIPFAPERVAQVRGWMTSRKEFEDALENEVQRLDHLQDQY